jgi:hypothetical protein
MISKLASLATFLRAHGINVCAILNAESVAVSTFSAPNGVGSIETFSIVQEGKAIQLHIKRLRKKQQKEKFTLCTVK